ncbi:MAG: TonB-dependent receptor [Alphaproteobacteria bacterium]|nr:TonB-dependent receptor [Alphaproteobacteria bacterium]MBV9373048.1 TonB-dependent receptor [Alphaproteobacteria bacterium]MBV9902931.1 TonB-dependent receptor [Alphaproteobacteria bacterium]
MTVPAPLFLLLAAAAAPPPEPAPSAGQAEIVVTGRDDAEPDPMLTASAPVTTRPGMAEAVGLPMVTDVLRVIAGAAVSTAGPRGSQTQVRLRGAEANHTLLVVDGIRFNDPAAGNEARFELLATDLLDRIDLVLGPDSARWGSEAIGGVLTAETRDAPDRGAGFRGRGEYGSLDSGRASAWAGLGTGKVRLSATGAWMASDGIDAFGQGGERDGFDNRSAAAKLVFEPAETVEVGAVGHWIEGRSAYDGFDPVTFRRADTLDETANRIGAVRGWVRGEKSGWTLKADASLLSSVNRNLLDDGPLNSTFGRRFTAGASLSKAVGGHVLTGAVERQAERFRARDQVYGGATDQDRTRALTAFLGEWRAKWNAVLTTDIAVRHDRFSAFADATTLRAGITVEPVAGLGLLAGFAEGIAQPTFYDLYGFFPNAFLGNPALKPERSTQWQGGVTYRWRGNDVGVYAYEAKLRDEIVDVFDPATFRSTTANATGTSRRRGVEAYASLRLARAAILRLSYAFLDAREQQVAGGLAVKEVRRPRHSAGLAGYGEAGRLSWGATLAWSGPRLDTDFDSFPARTVRLNAYWLGSAQLGWRVSKRIEAYVRAENAFDTDYREVVGYATPGRTVYAGLRLRLGD